MKNLIFFILILSLYSQNIYGGDNSGAGLVLLDAIRTSKLDYSERGIRYICPSLEENDQYSMSLGESYLNLYKSVDSSNTCVPVTAKEKKAVFASSRCLQDVLVQAHKLAKNIRKINKRQTDGRNRIGVRLIIKRKNNSVDWRTTDRIASFFGSFVSTAAADDNSCEWDTRLVVRTERQPKGWTAVLSRSFTYSQEEFMDKTKENNILINYFPKETENGEAESVDS